MGKPKILVFASGSKTGGGSGLQMLIESMKAGILDAEIVGVVSNHEHGGVRKHADNFGIEFVHMPKGHTAEAYQELVQRFDADYVILSGWLKKVAGLPVARTINIHPGPLPKFGGQGLYGHYVHEAVMKAFYANERTCSAVTMHFVSDEYDEGPIFFEFPVLIRDDDTADTLGIRVNKMEHGWQAYITNLVVHGHIRLETSGLVVPDNYQFLPKNK